MIKVRYIDKKYFEELLHCSSNYYEHKFLSDALNSQMLYSTLTRKKYIYFWLLYNKYFEIRTDVQREIHEQFGELKETSDAFKERKQQKYNSEKLKRITKEQQEREFYKEKGDKYFS